MSYSQYVSPSAAAATARSGPQISGPSQYGGIGRFVFFLVSIGLYFAFEAVIKATLYNTLGLPNSGEGGGLVMILAMIIWFVASFIIGMARLQNQGCESPLVMMLVGSLIPIVNLYVAWRLIACQEGFADEGQLDGTGKLLTLGYVALIGLAIYDTLLA